jgi:hypothetical protein
MQVMFTQVVGLPFGSPTTKDKKARRFLVCRVNNLPYLLPVSKFFLELREIYHESCILLGFWLINIL